MSLLARNHRPNNNHVSPLDRLKHQPRHSAKASRYGSVAVTRLIEPTAEPTPHRRHEVHRRRGKILEKAARLGAHMLRRSIGQEPAQASPEIPKTVKAVAKVPPAASESAPTREAVSHKVEIPLDAFDSVENIKNGNTRRLAAGTELKLHNPPIATARAAYDKLGVDVGTILAYIDLPSPETEEHVTQHEQAARRVYLIDRGSRLGNTGGSRDPEVVLVGHNHLEQMVQSQRDGGRTPAPMLRHEMPVIRKGESKVIGRDDNNWLPYDNQYVEAGMVPDIRKNLYANVSGIQAQVEITEDGGLYVAGLGKNKTNLVLGSDIDGSIAKDVWQGSMAGSPNDLDWQMRQIMIDPRYDTPQHGRHH